MPRRTIVAVLIMFSTNFCAVPAFSRLEPVTTSGRTVGRLPRKTRLRAERAVAGVAVRWLEAAYLGGSYPRRDFRKAFPGFTPGARNAARRDSRLMSNRGIGRRITAVTPTGIRVRVDLLAVRKRPVTGTAHVRVRFRTEGRVERAHWVAGRLMMTWRGQGWQVFAYDVARSQRHHKQKHKQQQDEPQKQQHPKKKKKDGGRR